MGRCKICGKATYLNYPYCRSCYEKIQNEEIKKYSPYSNNKKILKRINGKEILFDSKEEVRIAEIIEEEGYKFDYDQNYPYEENQTGKRFDFKLLRPNGEDYKKKIFIEVKCGEKDYSQEMLEKQKMTLEHGDEFIYSNKCSIDEIIEKLKKAIQSLKNK
jgi:hypothetical protein